MYIHTTILNDNFQKPSIVRRDPVVLCKKLLYPVLTMALNCKPANQTIFSKWQGHAELTNNHPYTLHF